MQLSLQDKQNLAQAMTFVPAQTHLLASKRVRPRKYTQAYQPRFREKNCVLLIYARSSLASKFGIAPANCVGVVDWDYRGEIICALHNSSDRDYTINSGDRIAQLVITPVFTPEVEEVTELSDTERGAGGFGSTGK